MLSFLGRYVLWREKYKIDIFEFIKYHIGHWSWWYPFNLSSSCWGWWVWGWLYNSNGVQTTQLIQRGRAGAWLPSRAAICPQLSWWYNYSAAVMLLPDTRQPHTAPSLIDHRRTHLRFLYLSNKCWPCVWQKFRGQEGMKQWKSCDFDFGWRRGFLSS